MDSGNTESQSRSKANETERNASNTSDVNISIELVKWIFTYMFKEQEKKSAFDNNIKVVDLSKKQMTWG